MTGRDAVGAPGQQWHVAVFVAGVTSCGRSLDAYPSRLRARLVPDDERCRGVGCRTAWPAHLRAVS